MLVYEFNRDLRYKHSFSNLNVLASSLLPVDSRAAFPSLHAAVFGVSMIYAWRYLRGWFWVLLPFSVGLWISTIYLRHHYVVDLLAGWALAPVAVWAAPRLDAWWAGRQIAYGYRPARGATATETEDGATEDTEERRERTGEERNGQGANGQRADGQRTNQHGGDDWAA